MMDFASLGTAIGEDVMDNINMVVDKYAQKQYWKKAHAAYTTQIRTKVADMRAAGINPILAVGGMGGTRGPSGPVTPTKGTSRSGAGAVASASAAKRAADIQSRLVDSQTRLNTTQGAKNITEASLNAEREKLTQQQIHTEAERQLEIQAAAEKLRVDTKVSSAMEKKVQMDALAQQYENYQREAQKWLYKGGKGKFVGFADWLSNKLPFFGKTKF